MKTGSFFEHRWAYRINPLSAWKFSASCGDKRFNTTISHRCCSTASNRMLRQNSSRKGKRSTVVKI